MAKCGIGARGPWKPRKAPGRDSPLLLSRIRAIYGQRDSAVTVIGSITKGRLSAVCRERCSHRQPLPKRYPPPSVIASERHIAERSNPVGRPPRLDCFTLRVRNDVEPLSKHYPPRGVLVGVAFPADCRPLNSTRPCPSLRASGTLPSEAIQWGGRLVWIASPYGFAMTWGRSLNGTRPEACCLVLLPRSVTDF
ncbi:MAG: hypothetical protein LBT00_16175 [Spirochaetaceae bacterium]|nr:hypothetical protein [Spirochaetaceae bacterium]